MATPKKTLKRYERQILDNSPELMINLTLKLLEKMMEMDSEATAKLQDDILTNAADWTELKEVTVWLWNRERNNIFMEDWLNEGTTRLSSLLLQKSI